MLHRSYIGALSILLLLHWEEGDAKETEGLRREPALLRPSDVPGDRERPAGTTLNAEPFPWVRRIQGSTSAVREFASRVTEILDRISKNWVSTGAKTVQNEEVRLRKLNGEVKEKLGELIRNGSKYGQRIIDCLNRTIFVAGLEKIVEDTTECYSRPLATVQEQLMRIEKEADDVLDRMESYGKRMFEMLSACFSEDSTPAVIECLQKVEGTNTGDGIQDKEVANLILEIARIVNDIPRTYSECTSKGIVETEAHVRKGYADSLSCFNMQ